MERPEPRSGSASRNASVDDERQLRAKRDSLLRAKREYGAQRLSRAQRDLNGQRRDDRALRAEREDAFEHSENTSGRKGRPRACRRHSSERSQMTLRVRRRTDEARAVQAIQQRILQYRVKDETRVCHRTDEQSSPVALFVILALLLPSDLG